MNRKLGELGNTKFVKVGVAPPALPLVAIIVGELL
jgi:hypothetical protein